jgi:hypothetical protein
MTMFHSTCGHCLAHKHAKDTKLDEQTKRPHLMLPVNREQRLLRVRVLKEQRPAAGNGFLFVHMVQVTSALKSLVYGIHEWSEVSGYTM